MISQHEVTQAAWKKIMGDNPSHFKGDRRPVESIFGWSNCQAFCRKTNLSIPHEYQWEYAYRGGTKTNYYWGSQKKANDYTWNRKNSKKKTQAVGQKKPNAFGLYDMGGNVWELVWSSNIHSKKWDTKEWSKTAFSGLEIFSKGGGFSESGFYGVYSYAGAHRSKRIGFRVCAQIVEVHSPLQKREYSQKLVKTASFLSLSVNPSHQLQPLHSTTDITLEVNNKSSKQTYQNVEVVCTLPYKLDYVTSDPLTIHIPPQNKKRTKLKWKWKDLKASQKRTIHLKVRGRISGYYRMAISVLHQGKIIKEKGAFLHYRGMHYLDIYTNDSDPVMVGEKIVFFVWAKNLGTQKETLRAEASYF